jgi:hypothetical protein
MAAEPDLPEFRVGQAVMLRIGSGDLDGKVVEDRGNLGVGGERIFRIAVSFDEGSEPREFEVPASALYPMPAPAAG